MANEKAVRLKCYLDNVIHVIHVRRDASEASVVNQMCRVFGEAVIVYQYEDNEHDIVTVGTGSSWLEEAILVYLHQKARRRKNDVSALKVYLKRTPMRTRSESDPAEFYRRAPLPTSMSQSVHRDSTLEQLNSSEGSEGGVEQIELVGDESVSRDARGSAFASVISPSQAIQQQNLLRSSQPRAPAVSLTSTSSVRESGSKHHHHQHTGHSSKHHSHTHHTHGHQASDQHHQQFPTLLIQPPVQIPPPPLPLPQNQQASISLQPLLQAKSQPQILTHFTSQTSQIEYHSNRSSTPQQLTHEHHPHSHHTHNKYSRASLPTPIAIQPFPTTSHHSPRESPRQKKPHRKSSREENSPRVAGVNINDSSEMHPSLSAVQIIDNTPAKRMWTPPDRFSFIRPYRSEMSNENSQNQTVQQLQSSVLPVPFQTTAAHFSRRRSHTHAASCTSALFTPPSGYPNFASPDKNWQQRRECGKARHSDLSDSAAKRLSSDDSNDEGSTDSSESENNKDFPSTSDPETEERETENDEREAETDGSAESSDFPFDESPIRPEYTRTPPRLEKPNRGAEKTPPSSPKHQEALTDNTELSSMPSPQPSPLPTPSLSPSPTSSPSPPPPVSPLTPPTHPQRNPTEIRNLVVPKCATALQNWKKMDRIGRGGFGTVYLGMNKDTGEIFAVKQIEMENISDENAQQLLKSYDHEIQLMKTLDHPNIVKYLGATIDGLMLNIFMEYVGGGSLSSILSKFGPFSENMVRSYTKQLLHGLSYLHQNNILHRDIKCANILLDTGVGRENVKLSDFGCSRNITDTIAQSQPNSVRGTPFWMAPEVMLAEGHGPSADIWSLACTIVEMVTGKPPWSQQYPNPTQAMHFICNTNTPLHIPSHLSPQLQQLLDTCLQRDPTQRPTAQQLLKHPFLTMERIKSTLSLSNLELSIASASIPTPEVPTDLSAPSTVLVSVSPMQHQQHSTVHQHQHTHMHQHSHSHQRQHSHSHQLDVMQLSFPKLPSPSQLSVSVAPSPVMVLAHPLFLLENLPPRVIVAILKFLSVADLRRLPQVCRTWAQVLKDDNIWQLVCLDYWNTVIVKDNSWKAMFTNYVCNQHAWAAKEIIPFVFKGHTKSITAIRCNYTRDPRVFTGSRDKNIKIWDLKKTRSVNTITGHRGTVTCLDFVTSESSGYSLLSGSEDKTIRIWYLNADCQTKRDSQIIGKHKRSVTCLSVDGTRLVTGSLDTTLVLWDLQTLTALSTLGTKLETAPLSVTFHSDVIAAGYRDGLIRLWDPRTPNLQQISQLTGHQGDVTTLQHVAGDNVLISGGLDGFIHRWDLKHTQCTKTFYSGAPVYGLSFDDVKVVSCGKDKVLKLWDIHSERCLRRLESESSVLCVQSDHGAIYSGGRDKRLRVWSLSSTTKHTHTTSPTCDSTSTTLAPNPILGSSSPPATSPSPSPSPGRLSPPAASRGPNATIVIPSSPSKLSRRFVPNLNFTGLLGKSSANREEERAKVVQTACKL